MNTYTCHTCQQKLEGGLALLAHFERTGHNGFLRKDKKGNYAMVSLKRNNPAVVVATIRQYQKEQEGTKWNT